jgi:hypothetical protein
MRLSRPASAQGRIRDRLYQAADTPGGLGASRGDDETFPGLLIMRTEGRMNFANAPNAREKLHQLVRDSKPLLIIPPGMQLHPRYRILSLDGANRGGRDDGLPLSRALVGRLESGAVSENPYFAARPDPGRRAHVSQPGASRRRLSGAV